MCPEEKQKCGGGREGAGTGHMFLLIWVPQSALSTSHALVLSHRNFRSHCPGPYWWNSLSWEDCLQDMSCYFDVYHLTILISPLHMRKGGKENSDKEHLERGLRYDC